MDNKRYRVVCQRISDGALHETCIAQHIHWETAQTIVSSMSRIVSPYQMCWIEEIE